MIWRILLCAVGGYVAGALLGALLVGTLSSNRHDRSMETAMTAIFVVGPIGAVVGGLLAWQFWRG
jgi:cation transporter-like permease